MGGLTALFYYNLADQVPGHTSFWNLEVKWALKSIFPRPKKPIEKTGKALSQPPNYNSIHT